MHHFSYHGSALHCEDVDLAGVARLYGTPTYVYSATTIADNVTRLQRSFRELDVQVCYAMKANSSLALLRHFANLGTSFDLVSGGEIRRVLAAGSEVKASVFAGVGKSEAEIELALKNEVFSFHVESEPELARINYVAGRLGVKAPIAIRINPNVDAKTHAKITTGKSDNKFGIPLAVAASAYEAASKLPHIRVAGIQMHIGSQLTTIGPFTEAVKKVVPVVAQLQADYGLEYFSIGGGIGIIYEDALASGDQAWWDAFPAAERPITPEAYGAALTPLLKDLGLKIMLEPGRFLVGNAGVMLSRVEYLKRGAQKNFLVIDAAMNDLARPAMYDAYHEVVPLQRDTSRAAMTADIVGPICESGDCFAKDREIQSVGEGELVAFMSAGAYGYTMSSRYNTRGTAAEVLVQGSSFELINARETFEQMIANEKIPAFLA
ncbi:diaminopimelate decarboxylase [Synoicihabitans lomoniglobus]|uniref:Diaminopimelate decarboxylase n=1 Tax=Synoicihabitans lomoniglobus TaxID=2909285 RepID=A0AAE9ZTK8_9BACT|nr:diaminopimelate decarboxylase [Opitutaceae bacterium LMO-M01]WED63867.1 diaminopimelate decarboxylase [Opitutaceae bacterium LMO-M01]